MSKLLDSIRNREERAHAAALLPLMSRFLDGAPQLGEHGSSLVIEATLLGRLVALEASLWGGLEVTVALGAEVPGWVTVYLMGAPEGEQPSRRLADDHEERRFLSRRVWTHAGPEHAVVQELYARLPPALTEEIDRFVGPAESIVEVSRRRLKVILAVGDPESDADRADLLAHGLRFACRMATALEQAWRTE